MCSYSLTHIHKVGTIDLQIDKRTGYQYIQKKVYYLRLSLPE